MENQEREIRIYVACLAAYKNGILHGCWIKANQETDEIKWQIHDMLKVSPIECAEEYAIHDFEGLEGVWIEEYASIDRVADIAAFIEEYGALGGKLIEYFGDIDGARDAISDRYQGCYSSLAEFAEEITQETTSIPDSLRFYIDYEAMARDLAIGDVLTIETGFDAVHVFWSN